MASQYSSTSAKSSSIPLSVLNDPPQECIWKRHRFQLSHSQPNRSVITGRSKPSRIWQYGRLYFRVDDDTKHAWRCGLCANNTLVLIDASSTSNARKHIIHSHRIDINTESTTPSKGGGDVAEEVTYRELYHVINVDTFRFHLIRWIVECHIPFNVVEDTNFQAMLRALNSTVDSHLLTSGDGVRNEVENEFVTAQNTVKNEVLAKAISRIHISCDLWSSPNGYALCGVAAHFVGHQGTVQCVLLALKRMRAAHGGEEIAEVIIDTLHQYDIVDNLGVFIADNAESNDVAWRTTLAVLHPQRDSIDSRSRCLGHIINLAAKAFLLGKEVEAFEAVVDQVNDSTSRDSEVWRNAQAAWRKRGPVGKLHNIIVFIRSSSQRKESFKATVVEGSKEGEY